MKTINLEEILFAEVDKLRKERVNVRLVPNEKMKEYQEWEYFMNAMKEACRQTLELAAENIKSDALKTYGNDVPACWDEKSILNTINQIE